MTFEQYKREQIATLTKQGFVQDGAVWKGRHYWATATDEMAPPTPIGRPCLIIKYFRPQ